MSADDYFTLDKTKSNFVSRELMEEFSDITVRNDGVALLPVDAIEDKTRESGLITTTQSFSQKHSSKAVVLKVGPGKLLKDGTRGPMDLKEGDIIWYFDGSPMQITRKGRATLVTREEFCIMKDTKTIKEYWK